MIITMKTYSRLFTILILILYFHPGVSSQTVPQIFKVLSANPEVKASLLDIDPKAQPRNLDAFLPLSAVKGIPSGSVYADQSKAPAERAMDVIRRLSFEEKIELTGGWFSFFFPGVERLGLRPVTMADASQGIRLNSVFTGKKSTSFPGMLSLTATWNPSLAEQFGNCIGEECRSLGVDVMLGPGLNMQRTSAGGRNFEYMGEDPVLASAMAVSYVKGLQSKSIIATGKHFIGNDQEFCRHLASSIIDERTLREIYLPVWEAVIKEGGIRAIMTGNNLVNGTPCCMNKTLNADLIRAEFGFKGIVMSDWANTNYYTKLLYLAPSSGHTLYMSNNQAFSKYIMQEAGKSPERKAEMEVMLGYMLFPNLLTFFEAGVYDRHPQDKSFLGTMEDHKKFARKVASESICLLKNDKNILPLTGKKTILMMGRPEIHSGTGSGKVEGYDHTTYAEGLKKIYGEKFTYLERPDDQTIAAADIVFFLLNKPGGEGYDVPFEEPVAVNEELMRVTKLNKNLVVIISSCNPLPMPWLEKVRGVIWAFVLGQERGNALSAIVSGEINPSGRLPFTIEKKFADSPNPAFNYLGGKPYWLGSNGDYLRYWLGQSSTTDNTFHLYVKPGEYASTNYKEGIFIGYRWYDKNNIQVQFPFGYGLSYTTFEYKDIRVDKASDGNGIVNVSFIVKNTGKVKGSEVAQLYVSDKQSSVERPVKELKGFRKVQLDPGEEEQISLTLSERDFAYWDETMHAWKAEPGEFEILVGSSANNIRLNTKILLE